MVFPVNKLNDAAKFYVYAQGEACGCQEEEECLQEERTECPVWGLLTVAYPFNFGALE